MNILIIDDEEMWCRTLSELLKINEYNVDYSLDTASGLGKLERKKFDVLILDKNVPTEMQSFQLLNIISTKKSAGKVSSYFKSLQIIIFTAYGTIETALKAWDLGVYKYIEKDIDIKKELFQSLLEIEIINKLHLPIQYAVQFFKIPELSNYLKFIHQPGYDKRDFILSLCYLSLLFRIGNFSASTLYSLIKDLKIIKYIPDFVNIDPDNVKFLHDVTMEILKMGYKDDCHYYFQAVQYLTGEKSPLLKDAPQFTNEWHMYYKIIIQISLMTDQIGNTDIAYKCRSIIEECLEKYNRLFSNYINKNYPKWIHPGIDKGQPPVPVLSYNIIEKYVHPLLKQSTYFIIFDGMRYDLWLIIKEIIKNDIPEYRVKEDLYLSVLPSTTLYARNSLIAGKKPEEIADYLCASCLNTNSNEENLLIHHTSLYDIPVVYLNKAAEQREELINIVEDEKYILKVLIFNFIDDLGHVIDEIKADDLQFRKYVKVSYEKSLMQDCLRKIADTGANIVITTDHGNIKTASPISIPGNTINDPKHSRFAITHESVKESKNYTIIENPHEWGLPLSKGDRFVLANGNVRFTGYNQPIRTEFVHGGISMEEMLIPVITMQPVLY